MTYLPLSLLISDRCVQDIWHMMTAVYAIDCQVAIYRSWHGVGDPPPQKEWTTLSQHWPDRRRRP